MLGLFLDGISITVMSLPITLPMVVHAGFDPLWFGVFLVIMVEIDQISAAGRLQPVRLKGLTGHPITTMALASCRSSS